MAERLERKLAAILAADGVGVQRLFAADPALANDLVLRFRGLFGELAERFGGRMAAAAGDDLLVEFASSVDAVCCAVESLAAIERRNQGAPEHARLQFHLAVHAGEVLVDGERLHGDGVQIALELLRFTEPGAICISGGVAEQVADRLDLALEDLGSYPLTGIPKPVRILRIRSGRDARAEPTPKGDAKGDGPGPRRLVAILEADAVSYSRHMTVAEDWTVRTVTSYRAACVEQVALHRGRVVDAVGDQVLAEFRSALDAVRCALAIQADLAARNAEGSPDRALQFRIGVHLGDVRHEGERIYGSGISVAQRLEALAPAGGLCVSAAVHEQVRHHLDADVAFEDMGEQKLKNIPDPVRAYRVTLAGAPRAVARWRRYAPWAAALLVSASISAAALRC